MSSTFLEIKSYKLRRSFMSRLQHNDRKTNLSSGKAKGQEFINHVSINDRKSLSKKREQREDDRTRTIISNEISKLEYRMKRAKGQKSKDKAKARIEKLIEERDNTSNLVKEAHKAYTELTFSITSLPLYRRDKTYAKELSELVNHYVSKNFPSMKVVLSVAHLDQASPHVHVNGFFNEYDSLTTDLNNSFGKQPFGKHYSLVQKDFNDYVQKSGIADKYNIKVDKVVKGGKKTYIKSLASYKAMQRRADKRASDIVSKYVDKVLKKNDTWAGIDYQKAIKDISSKLQEQYAKNLVVNLRSDEIYEIMENSLSLKSEVETLSNNKVALDKTLQNSLSRLDKLSDSYVDLESKHKTLKRSKEELETAHSKELRELKDKVKELENKLNPQVEQVKSSFSRRR